jgi:hypothetical protein
MARKKLRKLGQITGDLENLILELVVDHDCQWGEVLGIVKTYMEIHCPDAQEHYTDGTRPVYYYGHKESQ